MKESDLKHIVIKRGWIKCLYLNGYKPIVYIDPKTIMRVYYNTELGEYCDIWGKGSEKVTGLAKIICTPNETFVVYTKSDHTKNTEEVIDELLNYINWYKMG